MHNYSKGAQGLSV